MENEKDNNSGYSDSDVQYTGESTYSISGENSPDFSNSTPDNDWGDSNESTFNYGYTNIDNIENQSRSKSSRENYDRERVHIYESRVNNLLVSHEVSTKIPSKTNTKKELSASKAILKTASATTKLIEQAHKVSKIETPKSISNINKAFKVFSLGNLSYSYYNGIKNNDPKSVFSASFNAGIGIAVGTIPIFGPVLALPAVLISENNGWGENFYDLQDQYTFSESFYEYLGALANSAEDLL